MTQRDRPWVIRTYSGHCSARASNELYRSNLAKGQTGLSVAFDLPTQTGYDADDCSPEAKSARSASRCRTSARCATLFEGMPLEDMNTSMTINATAMWLIALYIALAEERGVDPAMLAGTTQNDIVKEYLSRGTFIFGPEPSRRLTVDVIIHTVKHLPRWNPINVCPYHLQEAGATAVQELAYGLATAVGVLDAVRDSGQVSVEDFPQVVGRISFFIDAGIRFVEEMCKMRAFTKLWDRICLERFGVEDEKLRRFRYGVQVNSLGLTEAQPENNVQRIVLEMLGVTLSPRRAGSSSAAAVLERGAGAAAVVGPAVVACACSRCSRSRATSWSTATSSRGRRLSKRRSRSCRTAAWEELQWVLDGGGAFEMIDEIKGRLVQSNAERLRNIESGETKVVGVNSFTETEPSPLTADLEGESHILVLDPAAEAEQIARLEEWRRGRDARGGRVSR